MATAGATSDSSLSRNTVAIVGGVVGVLVGASVILISILCIVAICTRHSIYKDSRVTSTCINE